MRWLCPVVLLLGFNVHACDDALVAKTAKVGQTVVIGDFGCSFPEKMIFRLEADRPGPDGQPQALDAVPFDDVCARREGGGFYCGPKAPLGLAGSTWKPVPTKVWSCKMQNYRPPKFICTKGCSAEVRKWAFFIESYECK